MLGPRSRSASQIRKCRKTGCGSYGSLLRAFSPIRPYREIFCFQRCARYCAC
ncbi:hypothetical protein BX666DRAFT_1883413 [Dichotomocladium elegans]|nr:hypothetical protein BX666DRAFT_1883413 [Dichotomocladium elegans]